MKEKEITELLKQNADTVVIPNVLDSVKCTTDLTCYKDRDMTLQKKSNSWFSFSRLDPLSAIATIMLIFVVVLVTVIIPNSNGNGFDTKVYSTVNLNATSSFEIKINSTSQVIDISTDPQGQTALQLITYKQKEFSQVITNLLNSCIDKGLLVESDLDNINLFSINSHNNNHHNQLQHHINGGISSAKEHCQSKHNEGGHNNRH